MKKLTVMILALAMLAAFAQTNMANPVTEYASLDEINSINIEQLNQAIDDLSSVVRPLAQFFGRGN